MLVEIIVKLNMNVKIKYKTRVIKDMCRGTFVNGWILNLSETRTLCQFLSTNPMFSVIYFILVLTDHP